MTQMTVTATLSAQKTAPLVLVPARHARWPRCLLVPGRHHLGSGPENEVQIDVEGVATDHAMIVVGTDRVILKAWDRRTWVNDGPVQECELRAGDRVSIGPCSWLVCNATTDDLLHGWPTPAARSEAPTPTPVVPVVTTVIETPLPVEQQLAPEASQVTIESHVEVVEATPTADLAEFAGDIASPVYDPIADTASDPDDDVHCPPPSIDHEADQLLQLQDELTQLRQELDDARSTWRQETHRRELELATESAQLTRRGAALERAEHELQRSREELDRLRIGLDSRAETIQAAEQQLSIMQQTMLEERQRLEVLSAQTRAELQQETARQSAAWTEWEVTQTRLLSDLAEQSRELEQRRHELQLERSRLNEERIDFEHVQRELRQAQREFQIERENWLSETHAWEDQCRIRDEQYAAVQEQWQRQQQQLAADVRERARSQAEYLESQQQLQHERRLFAEQQAAWIQERETLWTELSEQRRRLDRETQHLESTQQKVDELQSALAAELEAWQAARREAEQSIADAGQDVPDNTSIAEDAVVTEIDTDEARSVDALNEDPSDLTTELEEAASPEVFDLTEDVEAADTTDDGDDLEAIQDALDALAVRFEEFSTLEQRLERKHDELKKLQDDLAIREAALAAQTTAWQQEHAAWQEEFAADLDRREAWEISRQAEAAVMLAERRRYMDELTSWSVLSDTGIPASEVATTTTIVESQSSAPAFDETENEPHLEPRQETSEDHATTNSRFDPAVNAELSTEATELATLAEHVPTVADEIATDNTTSDNHPAWITIPEQQENSEAPANEVTATLEAETTQPLDEVAAADFATDKISHDESQVESESALESTSAEFLTPPPLPEAVVATDLNPENEPEPSGLLEHVEPEATPLVATVETQSLIEQMLATATAQASDAVEEMPADSHGPPSAELPASDTASLILHNDSNESDSAANPAPADTPDDGGLRSRLAEMFGLPEDFAARSTATPEQSADEEPPKFGADIGPSVDQPEHQDVLAHAETPLEEAGPNDDWRTRLSELLTQPKSEEPEADPSETPPTSSVTAASSSSQPDVEAEDSVSAYMERLLARTRRSQPETERHVTPVATPAPVTNMNAVPPVLPTESEAGTASHVSPPVIEQRKRLDPEATRQELQSFREVANLSARAAVAKHQWQTIKTEFGIQLGICSFSTVAAAYYLAAPVAGRTIAWGPALGCSVASVFVGWRAYQTWQRFSQILNGKESVTSVLTDNDNSMSESTKSMILDSNSMAEPDAQTNALDEATEVQE